MSRDPLKFGVMYPMQCPAGVNTIELIDDIICLAEHADRVGFDLLTTVEHPFFPELSINTSPIALFCTLAQRTQKLRFRPLCFTLGLHNPMVFAGELAFADLLTKGRIEAGIGRGHAWVWGPAGVPLEEVAGRYEEAIEILILAWTEERFSFSGKYFQVDDISVVPKPFQRPHPPIFQISTSDKWFRKAAQHGWGITIGGPAPEHVYERAIVTYNEACATAGSQPFIGYSKPIYLAETRETAIREARELIPRFIANGFAPMPSLPHGSATEQARLRAAGYDVYLSEGFQNMPNMSFDEIMDHKLVYVGTPREVGEQLLDLWDRFRYRELIAVVHYDRITRSQAMRTQALFAKEIMPMLRAEIDA